MSQRKGHKSIFGIYETEIAISSAIDRLKVAGFQLSDVSVLIPGKDTAQELALEKRSKAPEGVVFGIVSGIIIGNFLGILAADGTILKNVGNLGYMAFVTAGSRQSMFELAILGALAFGAIGGLIGWSRPEYEAKRYESHVKNGGVLLSVHVDDTLKKRQAKNILKDTGAYGVGAEREKPVKVLKTIPPNPFDKAGKEMPTKF